MDTNYIPMFAGLVGALIGSTASIVIVFIQNYFMSRNEKYKVQLKKSEFLFEKQYAALASLIAFRRTLNIYRDSPDMDWDEAEEKIGRKFDQYELKLDHLITEWGPVLPKKSLALLSQAHEHSAEAKFNPNPDPYDGTVKDVRDLIKLMDECIEELQNELTKQVVT